VGVGILIFIILRVYKPNFLFAKKERIGLTGRYTVNNLPSDILNLISDGLTKIDYKGVVSPSLATSWETTDNGATWVFHLDIKRVWQDNKKVDSASINYSFSDAVIEKPDASTIVFKLKNPFAPFPFVVSRPAFKKGLLGTGKWKVTKISLVGEYVESLSLKDKEGNQRIYKFYPTEDKTKEAFVLGQVDTLSNILNSDDFNKWPVTITKQVDKQSFTAVFLNVDDNLLNDKSIRQALAYAIDKDKLGEDRAISPLSPDSWAYNPQVKQYNYDQTRAKELITALPAETKSNLNIKLTTTPILLPVAEKIVSDWQKIGVNSSVNVSSNVQNGDYQAILVIFQIPLDPDQYFLWHSTQTATNISNYKNPRIDKLLEDGRIELNTEQRKLIYWDFQRFLVEDSPAIFLYHPVFYTVNRK
jgi:peptide/nickel transport system substrate-binding protein